MEGTDSSQGKYGKISFTEPSLQVFFQALDLSWIEGRIETKYSANKRRPPLPFIAQVRAHLFKDIRQIKSYRKLAKTLAEHDGMWARLLGFKKPPHHDSFSAFRTRLGSQLFLEIFLETRRRTLQLVPGLAQFIAIDSTAVQAYGRDRRGKSSDPDATWGRTTNTKNGKDERFYGYKLHTALAAPYGAPSSIHDYTGSPT
jgi:hypothetical protein